MKTQHFKSHSATHVHPTTDLIINKQKKKDKGTAITKGKTPVPLCSPKLSPVGRG